MRLNVLIRQNAVFNDKKYFIKCLAKNFTNNMSNAHEKTNKIYFIY
jgi:hypothetical protein